MSRHKELAGGGSFAGLPEHWWFCPPAKPNCAAARLLGCSEPRAQLLARVAAFRKWLLQRPEREVVVVGHSTFFKYLLQTEGVNDRRLKNGELYSLSL